MSETRSLILEILSGPLDGATISLTSDTAWGRTGTSPLTFPWDAELGVPQARFSIEREGKKGRWQLEGLDAPHGTYRVNREERLTRQTVPLARGDILRASQTWLLVRQT